MGHVDAVVQDVRGGRAGRRVGEHDALGEGRVRGGESGGGGGLVGRRLGEGRRDGRGVGHVRRGGHHSLHHLLLLDAGRGGGPPAGPHAWVGRVGVVLGPWTLQVVLKSTVQVSVV